MALSFVAVNFWLFDPLLQPAFIPHLDSPQSKDKGVGEKRSASSHRGKPSTTEYMVATDVHELLDAALTTLRTDRGGEHLPNHPRRRMGWFPILNPLLHFNGEKGAQAKASFSASSLQAMVQQFPSKLAETDDLDATVAASSGFADFDRITGKSLNQYVAAYNQSPNSSFSRFSKFLRKRHMGCSTNHEIMLYLSHPFFREDAREHFLEGKNLPLLEVDILHAWAAANQIPLPALVASSVVEAEGEINGTNINQARVDGKRLTRQQIIDQAKALLPFVLEGITKLDIANRHQSKNHHAIFHHLCALFALASLYRDPEIMALTDSIEPGIPFALRRMSLQDTARTQSLSNQMVVYTHLRLFRRNGGFYPCDKAAGDAMIERFHDDQENIASTYQLPPFHELAIPGQWFQDLHRLRESASMLGDATALLMPHRQVLPGRSDGMTRAQLVESAKEVEGIVTSIEASRLYDAIVVANNLMGDRFEVHLPENHEDEARLRDISALPYASLISNQEKMQRESLPILEVLGSALKRFVVNNENEQQITNSVLPKLKEAQRRLDGFIEEGAAIAEKGQVPMLVSSKLTFGESDSISLWALLADTASPEKVATIDSMIRLAHEYRYILGQARHLATLTDQEGESNQAAISNALASLQPTAADGDNTFRALDDLMVSLDDARAKYAHWASSMAATAEQYAMEIDHLFTDAQVVPIPAPSDLESAYIQANGPASEKEDDQPETASVELSRALTDANAQLESALETIERISIERDTLQEQADQAIAQAQSLSHHLGEAERSRQSSPGQVAVSSDLLAGIADFAESPTPLIALDIANALFPTQLIFLDSAFDSARDANETLGGNILRRLVLLGTEGLALMHKGRPLYELNDILPGELACQESESCMTAAKLRSQRVFKEVLPEGDVKEWLMTAHNWINYSHRLYFDYDHQRGAFVIGHVGRHLEIASA